MAGAGAADATRLPVADLPVWQKLRPQISSGSGDYSRKPIATARTGTVAGAMFCHGLRRAGFPPIPTKDGSKPARQQGCIRPRSNTRFFGTVRETFHTN